MNFIEQNITSITQEIIEKHGLFLIELIIRGNEKNRVIEIFVDGEENVSAGTCAELSREITGAIEEKEMIQSSYRLDVSSPGVDRPLKFLKQYPKHINRKFELSYTDGESTKKLAGLLKSVNGKDLLFLVNNQNEITINFNNIKKAKVIASFS